MLTSENQSSRRRTCRNDESGT